jgi:hypothetical protein
MTVRNHNQPTQGMSLNTAMAEESSLLLDVMPLLRTSYWAALLPTEEGNLNLNVLEIPHGITTQKTNIKAMNLLHFLLVT